MFGSSFKEQTTNPRSQRVSYLRVSSTDQNLTRQREAVNHSGHIDREFTDELSGGAKSHRPGLEDCINYLREDDVLVVASIDRLARSLVDLRVIIDRITDKGASVIFLKENLTFAAGRDDPRANLMLGILGSFAEFERSIIRERQAEGIALAKKAGKYAGRPKALDKEQIQEAKDMIAQGETKSAVAKHFGINRSTLYEYLKNPD